MTPSNFKSEAYRQLVDIFTKTQAKTPDAEAKARTQGFIYAGQFMGVISKEEAQTLIELAHFDVFKMSIARRVDLEAKQKQAFEEMDEAFFEIPTVLRQPG